MLTLEVYKATDGFPKGELYGLTSQMRRSSASIPTNIAEGSGRNGGGDFARFLDIAMGSACELEYRLILAHDLHLFGDEEYIPLDNKVTEVKRMLTGLIKRVRS